MGEMRNLYRILIGKVKGRDHPLENIDVDGSIILEWETGCGILN
jgi:hypothetical protein